MNKATYGEPGARWRIKVHKSIQAKFLLGFTALFTSAFIVFGLVIMQGLPFSSFDGWTGNARQEAVSSLNLIADLRKERILKWLSERQGDAQVVANSQIIKANLVLLLATISSFASNDWNNLGDLLRTENKAALNQIYTYLSLIQNAYAQHGVAKYERIRVIDAKTGRVLVSTEDTEIGFPVGDYKKYSNIVNRTRRFFIGDVNSGNLSPVPHIDIAHPIIDPEGVVIGIVELGITLANVFDPFLYGSSGFRETGEALLVNERGYILTPLRYPLADGTEARVLEHQITANPARFAAAGREGMIESKDYRGRDVIAAFRYLRISPDWGWGMVVKIDRSELFTAMNKGIRYSIWIGVVGIFLVVALSVILTRQLTRPLRHMTKVAGRLAAGDRSVRTQLKSDDEIGQLSSAFDSMAEDTELSQQDLERRIGERTILLDKEIRVRRQAEEKIQQLNINLEKKVTRRTAELSAANKELESFAYSVAHDLRAPLRAIDGFSQALVEDYGERLDGEAKDYLGYLREGSQEMGRLIDDLLKLSRVTRGVISREDIDLSQLVAEILESLRQTYPDRNVVTDIAPGVMVNADRRFLRLALENLLGNAWKFTAKEVDAYIEFGAEHTGGKVRCFVRDNGVGFNMAYQNKLFAPFQRLHSSDDFEGTGIGLSTVQRIINRLGGTIQAVGGVDEGACFTFELDAQDNNND